MFAAIIILLFVIGLTYRQQKLKPGAEQLSFIYRHKKLIALFGLVIIPVVLLNIFLPKVYLEDASDIVSVANENNSHIDREKAYLNILDKYPDSIPLYLEVMDFYSDNYYDKCNAFDMSLCRSGEVAERCQLYRQAQCQPEDSIVLDSNQKEQRFFNYIAGVSSMNRNNVNSAIFHFEKETKLNPGFPTPYHKLQHIAQLQGPEKYRAFLETHDLIGHLPIEGLIVDYYIYGLTGKYIEALIDSSFFHIDPRAFFAALFISIIWLVFIRSMDIFNRESWRDMIIVFVGGALFTFFCIPIYDYFHYSLDFYPNGTGLTDFLYCTFVIGGSEETVKLIPWVLFAVFSGKMKEPYDYILYASVSALGFAFAENWMYLESSENIVGRSILSTAAHMFDASIVAYSVILVKYRLQSQTMKFIVPVIGFFLAMLSHGFYDFWLISPAGQDYSWLTIVFFILSMHVWFYMKNNATNHSVYFVKGKYNGDRQVNLMLFSFMAVLMMEFTLLSFQYGAEQANGKLAFDAILISIFLTYMTVILMNYQPQKGVWQKLSIPVPAFMNVFEVPDPFTTERPRMRMDVHNMQLTLYAPKSNKYVGYLLPISGTCIHEVAVGDRDDAYLFELDRELGYSGYHQRYTVVKVMQENKTLAHDKVLIYFFLIPLNVDPQDRTFDINELRYTGRVYSRPNHLIR